ncbi:hypothetical protein HYH03_016867 [Edaphochlamys debaryana]|uniref:Calmodulin n=1 Tax=Edaphochlamys debaryana TaxID=47281 RepID=A0A835XNT6_9CHLO|nr:hypothetical protein HYH03_016867 [Edaphochlamys debaryana]|eukprot:KAG2484325.1 hypothetical protein HYH03_016867 [Edaphochlamys debaryana]
MAATAEPEVPGPAGTEGATEASFTDPEAAPQGEVAEPAETSRWPEPIPEEWQQGRAAKAEDWFQQRTAAIGRTHEVAKQAEAEAAAAAAAAAAESAAFDATVQAMVREQQAYSHGVQQQLAVLRRQRLEANREYRALRLPHFTPPRALALVTAPEGGHTLLERLFCRALATTLMTAVAAGGQGAGGGGEGVAAGTGGGGVLGGPSGGGEAVWCELGQSRVSMQDPQLARAEALERCEVAVVVLSPALEASPCWGLERRILTARLAAPPGTWPGRRLTAVLIVRLHVPPAAADGLAAAAAVKGLGRKAAAAVATAVAEAVIPPEYDTPPLALPMPVPGYPVQSYPLTLLDMTVPMPPPAEPPLEGAAAGAALAAAVRDGVASVLAVAAESGALAAAGLRLFPDSPPVHLHPAHIHLHPEQLLMAAALAGPPGGTGLTNGGGATLGSSLGGGSLGGGGEGVMSASGQLTGGSGGGGGVVSLTAATALAGAGSASSLATQLLASPAHAAVAPGPAATAAHLLPAPYTQKAVEDWTTYDTTVWLASLGRSLARWSAGFVAVAVDGPLLAVAEEEDLRALGVGEARARVTLLEALDSTLRRTSALLPSRALRPAPDAPATPLPPEAAVLPPPQRAALLGDIFTYYDQDHSGDLNQAELGRLVAACGLRLSEERLKDVLDDYDDDADGALCGAEAERLLGDVWRLVMAQQDVAAWTPSEAAATLRDAAELENPLETPCATPDHHGDRAGAAAGAARGGRGAAGSGGGARRASGGDGSDAASIDILGPGAGLGARGPGGMRRVASADAASSAPSINILGDDVRGRPPPSAAPSIDIVGKDYGRPPPSAAPSINIVGKDYGRPPPSAAPSINIVGRDFGRPPPSAAPSINIVGKDFGRPPPSAAPSINIVGKDYGRPPPSAAPSIDIVGRDFGRPPPSAAPSINILGDAGNGGPPKPLSARSRPPARGNHLIHSPQDPTAFAAGDADPYASDEGDRSSISAPSTPNPIPITSNASFLKVHGGGGGGGGGVDRLTLRTAAGADASPRSPDGRPRARGHRTAEPHRPDSPGSEATASSAPTINVIGGGGTSYYIKLGGGGGGAGAKSKPGSPGGGAGGRDRPPARGHRMAAPHEVDTASEASSQRPVVLGVGTSHYIKLPGREGPGAGGTFGGPAGTAVNLPPLSARSRPPARGGGRVDHSRPDSAGSDDSGVSGLTINVVAHGTGNAFVIKMKGDKTTAGGIFPPLTAAGRPRPPARGGRVTLPSPPRTADPDDLPSPTMVTVEGEDEAGARVHLIDKTRAPTPELLETGLDSPMGSELAGGGNGRRGGNGGPSGGFAIAQAKAKLQLHTERSGAAGGGGGGGARSGAASFAARKSYAQSVASFAWGLPPRLAAGLQSGRGWAGDGGSVSSGQAPWPGAITPKALRTGTRPTLSPDQAVPAEVDIARLLRQELAEGELQEALRTVLDGLDLRRAGRVDLQMLRAALASSGPFHRLTPLHAQVLSDLAEATAQLPNFARAPGPSALLSATAPAALASAAPASPTPAASAPSASHGTARLAAGGSHSQPHSPSRFARSPSPSAHATGTGTGTGARTSPSHSAAHAHAHTSATVTRHSNLASLDSSSSPTAPSPGARASFSFGGATAPAALGPTAARTASVSVGGAPGRSAIGGGSISTAAPNGPSLSTILASASATAPSLSGAADGSGAASSHPVLLASGRLGEALLGLEVAGREYAAAAVAAVLGAQAELQGAVYADKGLAALLRQLYRQSAGPDDPLELLRLGPRVKPAAAEAALEAFMGVQGIPPTALLRAVLLPGHQLGGEGGTEAGDSEDDGDEGEEALGPSASEAGLALGLGPGPDTPRRRGRGSRSTPASLAHARRYPQAWASVTAHVLFVYQTPAPVLLPDAEPVTAVAAGAGHTLCLTESGRVFAWGCNSTGQLGLGRGAGGAGGFTARPSLVEALTGQRVVSIAAGAVHSLAVTEEGRLYAWGAAAGGRLGLGRPPAADGEAAGAGASGRGSPWEEEEGPGARPDGSTGGGASSRGAAGPVEWLPRHVTGGALAGGSVRLRAAYAGSCAVASGATDRDGRVLTWGPGALGQLGHGGREDEWEPRRVDAPSLRRTMRLALGGSHALACRADERVHVWGSDPSGAGCLGSGPPAQGYGLGAGGGWGGAGGGGAGGGVREGSRALLSPALFRLWFKDVAAGLAHGAGVSSDGRLYTWGWGGALSGAGPGVPRLPVSADGDAEPYHSASASTSSAGPSSYGPSASTPPGPAPLVRSGGGHLGVGGGVDLPAPTLVTKLEVLPGQVARQDGGDPFSYQDSNLGWLYRGVDCGPQHTVAIIQVARGWSAAMRTGHRTADQTRLPAWE